MKKALVCGAGGFIGSHMVKRLKKEGFWARGVDLKYPEFSETDADDFVIGDLRDQYLCSQIVDCKFNEVYQFAADMGGAGYIFTGENDADVMHNSGMINLNMLDACLKRNVKRIFYSSSACIYPEYNQLDPDNPNCAEDSAYPAEPDSDIRMGKALQRAALSCLPPQLRHGSAHCPLSQHLRTFGNLGWRQGKGSCCHVPQGGHG